MTKCHFNNQDIRNNDQTTFNSSNPNTQTNLFRTWILRVEICLYLVSWLFGQTSCRYYNAVMDTIEKLSQLFEKFPGIGPRQAQRFVQFLLRSPQSTRRELVESIRDLSSSVHQCPECMRFSASKKGLCSICNNSHRDQSLLAIVASDADLLALERSHTYKGRYFVLGGLISLSSEKMTGLRIRELLASIPKRSKSGLREAILVFPANPEGDSTGIRIQEELSQGEPLRLGLKITKLGRGLSTGSELEYADPDTLKSALDNRK